LALLQSGGRRGGSTDIAVVDLPSVVERSLGDLEVASMRPKASRFDFKNRITEYEGYIRQLRSTLAEQKGRRSALCDTLRKVQEEVNARLRVSGHDLATAQEAADDAQSRLAAAQQQARERDEALEALRQDLDVARREEQKHLLVTTQLTEREVQLQQMNADLRENLRSIQEMYRGNCEQVQLERKHSQDLEVQLRETRTGEEQLRERLRNSEREAEVAKAELADSRRQVMELQSNLTSMDAERERLEGIAAEGQGALTTTQGELERTSSALTAKGEELAILGLQLREAVVRADGMTQERNMLQVEFDSYKQHHSTTNQEQVEAITELRLSMEQLTQKVDTSQTELKVQEGEAEQKRAYIRTLESNLKQAERARRELHNAIQELKGNIRVFCRVRPMPPTEEEGASPETALRLQEMNKVSIDSFGESYNFSFDKVFEPSTAQADVFDEVSGLVQSALDGYKVCIFAYGQTGSGKTFTMQGTEAPQGWGLIPRSLSKIFQACEATRGQGWTWQLHASFLEVYNESLRDLLRVGNNTSGSGAAPVHVIKHDEAWGTVVTNMTCVEVDGQEQIATLMARAARSRAVGCTDMNEVSSRSHSVFSLYITGRNSELGSELLGALHLVDLAGSERLDRSGATGDRLKETQNINRSLSSLADVFLAKAEGRSHVPFRNSKLTHLMEPCLSGQGKTLMLVNIGPEAKNASETLCSLRFAAQVSQCDTGGKPKRSAKALGGAAADSTGRLPTPRPQTPTQSQGGPMHSARRAR